MPLYLQTALFKSIVRASSSFSLLFTWYHPAMVRLTARVIEREYASWYLISTVSNLSALHVVHKRVLATHSTPSSSSKKGRKNQGPGSFLDFYTPGRKSTKLILNISQFQAVPH